MKFLKKHLLIIIIFTFLTSFIVFKVLEIKNYYENNLNILHNYYTKECVDKTDIDVDMCQLLLEEYISANEYMTPTFFGTIFNLLDSSLILIDFFAFFILTIPTLVGISSLFKDQVLITYLTKQKYSTFLKELFKRFYRYIWLFSIILLIFFLMVYSFTKMSSSSFQFFDYNLVALTNKPILFLAIYLINSLLLSVVYLNILAIALRFKHDYFSAILTSFLIYLAVYLIFAVGVNYIIFQNFLFLDTVGELFTLNGVFAFNVNNAIGPLERLEFTISILLLSSLFVYLAYRSKEKLIIDCEKNNREEL